MIPNCIFPSKGNTNHLTPEEAYLFSFLYRMRLAYGFMAFISIDGISARLPYKFYSIKSNGDGTRNKNKIRELLLDLRNKEYIGFDESIEKMKSSELFHIYFYEFEHYYSFTKGHNQNITAEIFDQFNNPLEFYTYAYIDCFGDKGKVLSYEDWEDVLGIKTRTVQKIIDKMNTYEFKPRIWKFSGDYLPSNKQARQEMNTYFTRPDTETIKKWNGYYTKDGTREWELAFGYKGSKSETEGNGVWGVEELF